MSYFEDLTPYTYYHLGIAENTVNVGWLDKNHSYQQGKISKEIVNDIWQFLQSSILRLRGFHVCELCPSSKNEPLKVNKDNETLHLGTAEIRIIGENGKVYAAPDLIYHYIITHNYRPPDEFLQAIIKGPKPHSDEYKRFLKSRGYL